ncbi:Homoserine dehydrogenase [Arcobacter nitrofigilis DSM 7299]|uniref:Homoserine dehydrogenase n=1 Tax=Arcobacter nitrofigilis (strain ATCC 33309 / DSM 7299 / CCUG 15893 / LMG 7604 / NCTC 12251 / CI) TaxID=572480 RepID=D5V4A1_ARCNC|nr:homoserine dehydrogenase [Arcobacter nitrofigilis]ADG91834.1 Homoserine dehydrogenase [Arcobacter nitrofigilis DSM 7299]
MLKIAIIGVGTVGASVANILKDNKDIITSRAGVEIVPTIGVVNDLSKKRDVSIELTDDLDKALNDDSIDIIVELMGGVERPYEIIKRALSKGKPVVTANKALLAYHRYDLEKLAGDIPFEYEAAVAGGIPIINALRDGLSANNIESIRGILNGTCNYMLTRMINDGIDYESILKEAQELGYAEADPTFDVGGFDAAHKLLILASIAYDVDAKPEDILIEGIQNIDTPDIDFANEFNYSIKLLAIAKRVGKQIELRVHPVFIPKTEMIAKVDGVMNGISVIGDKVGETMYYGPGAGGNATASAVIANIVDIARRGKGAPMLGFEFDYKANLTIMPKDEIETKYYLRLRIEDKVGVLAKVTKILGEHEISIEKMIQKPYNTTCAHLLLSTHVCIEKNINKALKEIENSGVATTKPVMIRIED